MNDLPIVTSDDIAGWYPCDDYTDRLTNGDLRGYRVNALDILMMKDIPHTDRLWAVIREDMVPAPILHEFACRCAEQVLKLVDNHDPRSVAAIVAKRAWFRGDFNDYELAAVWAAARDASWDAARAAQCQILTALLEES